MKRIEDERIIAEKRRINSNAFGICFLALWGILLYRQYVLGQAIGEYIDIFLLTIGLSIYITLNNVFRGLYLTYRSRAARKKIQFVGALAGSISFVIVQYFITGYDLTSPEDTLKLVVSFMVFLLFWIGSQSLLLGISQRKADEEAEED
jgi:hypothetical protein